MAEGGMAEDGGGRVVWEGGGVERWGREGGRGVVGEGGAWGRKGGGVAREGATGERMVREGVGGDRKSVV